MKRKLKLLPLLVALFISALFLQCAKDDAGLNDDAKQFGPEVQKPAEYLKGAKKQAAIQALEKQFANAGRPAPQMRQVSSTARSSESWAVEFEEILLVTDTLGQKNFTYRVTHPRMSETVFYNLVHTEFERGKYFYTTVKLVRYEMTDEFAGQYARGVKDIADFTGVIKFSPIAESKEPILTIDPPTEAEPVPEEPPLDPCEDDVVIVVPPPRPGEPKPGPVYIGGGAGGGSSGPGAEPDLSYYFGMASVHQAGTCWDWVKVPCSEGLHYGEAGCVAEHKGATYLLNYCNGKITSVYGRDSNPVLIGDPCQPVGYVGVLGPIKEAYKKALKIVAEIDDDELDACSKEVLDELKGLTQSSMARILTKFDTSPSVYKLTIKTKDTVVSQNFSPAFTRRNDPTSVPYNYTIYIRPEYIHSNNKLARASLILHEFIHAYLLSLVDDVSNSNPNAFNDFPQLFELLLVKKFGPNNNGYYTNLQHEIMAKEYVDILGRALQEFNTGIPVPPDSQPLQPYTDLAWAGLKDAPIYQTTDLLTNSDRDRINNRYASEMMHNSYGGQTQIGSLCTE